MERHQPLPSERNGFRARLSAQDSILEFTSAMEHSKRHGLPFIGVFLDIEKAFDRAQLIFVLDRHLEMEVENRALHILRVYLCSCHFAVKISNVFSTLVPLTCGLPQGSVLSPLLFNVAMSKMIPSDLGTEAYTCYPPFMLTTCACCQQHVRSNLCNVYSQLLFISSRTTSLMLA